MFKSRSRSGACRPSDQAILEIPQRRVLDADAGRIAAYAQANDLILTTNNAADFRRLYARQELHPGLLLIIPSVERETQIRLFQAALAKLAEIGEPVNQIIEAHLDGNGICLEQFEWPTSPG